MSDAAEGQRSHRRIFLDQQPIELNEREQDEIQSFMDRFTQLVRDLDKKSKE